MLPLGVIRGNTVLIKFNRKAIDFFTNISDDLLAKSPLGMRNTSQESSKNYYISSISIGAILLLYTFVGWQEFIEKSHDNENNSE